MLRNEKIEKVDIRIFTEDTVCNQEVESEFTNGRRNKRLLCRKSNLELKKVLAICLNELLNYYGVDNWILRK